MQMFHAFASNSSSSLPEDIASWPTPNESDCWALNLKKYFSIEAPSRRGFGLSWLYKNRILSKKELKNCKAALEAALTRRDINELELSAICVPKKKVTDLVKRLLAQEERNWTVRYTLGAGDISRDLAWLGHLKSQQSLRLSPSDSDVTSPWNQLSSVASMLRSFPNLEQLNLNGFILCPAEVVELYQDEYLAARTPHISLTFFSSAVTRFPAAANDHLISLLFSFGWPSPTVLSGWIKEASKLEKLLSFTFLVSYEPAMETYQECFQALYDWIGSPSCSLVEFVLIFPDEFKFSNSDDDPSFSLFQNLTPAIAKNHSLQRLVIWSEHLPIDCMPPILSAISTESSCINFFAVWYNWGDSQDVSNLLRWQIEMRWSTPRFMTLCPLSIREEDRPVFAKIQYVNGVHDHWQNWQKYIRNGAPIPHEGISLERVDRCFWARELKYIDKTTSPGFRSVSLDAMYYLMQVWLCSVSEMPDNS